MPQEAMDENSAGRASKGSQKKRMHKKGQAGARRPGKVSHDSRDTRPAGVKYRTKSEIHALSIARFMRYRAGWRAVSQDS